MIRKKADGIQAFSGRPCRNQNAKPRKVIPFVFFGQPLHNMLHQHGFLRQLAGSNRLACQPSGLRRNYLTAKRLQTPDIFLYDRILIHMYIHRRRKQDGTRRRNHRRSQKIICNAACQLSQNIRRRGRDQKQIRLLPQRKMRNVLCHGPVKRFHMAGMLCQRFKRDRRNKLRRMLC